MPVDPQVQALLDEMRAHGREALRGADRGGGASGRVVVRRAAGRARGGRVGRAHFIPGPTAELPSASTRPKVEGPFPGLVYFHGSGWVVLNIAVCDTTMRALANSTGCVVVAVNYQKAPEHPFPIPFEDCWAATNWTFEHAEELNVDADPDRRDRRQRRRQPRRRRRAARPRRGRARSSPTRR